MATRTARLLRSADEPPEKFASVGKLAARLDGLREGRPIVLVRTQLSIGERGAEAVAVRWADDRGGRALGYAVIADPETGVLPGADQYELLSAAIARQTQRRAA